MLVVSLVLERFENNDSFIVLLSDRNSIAKKFYGQVKSDERMWQFYQLKYPELDKLAVDVPRTLKRVYSNCRILKQHLL